MIGWCLLIILSVIGLAGAWLIALLLIERRQPRLVCLMYHRFVSLAEYQRAQRTERIFTMAAEHFDRQLSHLKESGYTFVSADQARSFAAGALSLPARSVLLTFDDGCLSAYELALPILRRHHACATMFVTTDPESYVFNLPGRADRRLADDELRAIDGDTLRIESHGVTHRPLTGLREEEIRYELAESKKVLSQLLSRDVAYLAIPGNWYNRRVMGMAREVGYQAVWCSNPGAVRPGSNLFGLQRVNVEGTMTLRQFASAIRPWGMAWRRWIAAFKRAPRRLLGVRFWLPVRAALLRLVPGQYLSARRLVAGAGLLAALVIVLTLIWLLVWRPSAN
jgi:peptidoglycan/xylan/chitin deacetylase (PgdA/CDA1 family)